MKILTLIGTRPQLIKEAIMSNEFAKKEQINEIIVNSGQHYDYEMNDIFYKNLNLRKPKYNLNVKSGSHTEVTAKIMLKLEPIVEKESPDLVVIYGDTNTTLAGALVASKSDIPIAHIEAGIRMKPKNMPEEINRIIVDRIATFFFTANKTAVNNLKKEHVTDNVHFVGDIMYDLFKKMQPTFNTKVLDEHNLESNKYILLTLHRNYNVDKKITLKRYLKKIQDLSKKYKILWPLHPRTKKRIEEFNLKKYLNDIIITKPLGYIDMMSALTNCKYIITDSGGLQKEAYFAGKHAVVVMPDTGWREPIKNGFNVLSQTNFDYREDWLGMDANSREMIYGDGDAGKKIVNILLIE